MAAPITFAAAAGAVRPLDHAAATAAGERHDRLAKPRGSLGRLEAIGIQLAAIAGACPPPSPAPAAVAVFAADHGAHAQGVTPWPQEVTARMVAALTGGTAAINVLARQAGASLTVVDVGVVAELDPAPTLLARKVRRGTADLAVGPAMTGAEANRALDVGTEVATRLVAGGARALVTGEVGIANTTAAAAVIAAFTGRPAGEVTGRGCGVDDATLARKLTAVESALVRTGAAIDPLEVLVSLGGLEIAALAGFIAGGAAARVPVVIDGVTTLAALLVATSMVPEVLGYCIAGHRSPEPGAAAVLDRLGLSPVVDLGLRLGEGTGACLALPTLEAAGAVLAEMATLEEAGVACAPHLPYPERGSHIEAHQREDEHDMDAAAAAVAKGLNGLPDWHGYNDADACGPGRGPDCAGYWFKTGVIATIAAPAIASDPEARAEVATSMTDDEIWAEVERRHLVKQLGKCRCGRVFEPPVYTRRAR